MPRSRAPLVLLILLAAAAALAFWPDMPEPAPIAPVRIAAPKPVAAPMPVMDPSVAMVAALLPPAAAATLPLDGTEGHSKPPERHLDITVHDAQPMTEADPAARDIQRGITLARAGDSDGAEAAVRASLERDPHNPLALYNLAVLADRRGDVETARTLYDATLQALASRPMPAMPVKQVAARLDVLDRQAGPPTEAAE